MGRSRRWKSTTREKRQGVVCILLYGIPVKSTNHRINQNNDGASVGQPRDRVQKRPSGDQGCLGSEGGKLGASTNSRARSTGIHTRKRGPADDKFVDGVNNRGCFCDLMMPARRGHGTTQPLCLRVFTFPFPSILSSTLTPFPLYLHSI